MFSNSLSSFTNAEISSAIITPRDTLAFAVENGIVECLRVNTAFSGGFGVGTRIRVLGVRA